MTNKKVWVDAQKRYAKKHREKQNAGNNRYRLSKELESVKDLRERTGANKSLLELSDEDFIKAVRNLWRDNNE
jgi:hypothetical protein